MAGVVQFADLGTVAKPKRSVSNCFLKFDGKKRVLDFESGRQGPQGETHTEKKIDTDPNGTSPDSTWTAGGRDT